MPSVDPRFLSTIRYRCIGPTRGGRAVAVAADPKKRSVFYFGAVAGGVWKSDDCRAVLGERHRRIPHDGLDRSARGRAVRRQRHLRRHRRVDDPHRRHARRRRVQVDRRRRDMAPHGPDRHRATSARSGCTRPIPTRSTSRRSGTRSKDNPERGLYRSKRRWATPGSSCCTSATRAGAVDVVDRPEQPADPLRHHLAGAPHVLVDRQRRPRQWAVAIARRRRHVGEHQRQRRACPTGTLGKIGVSVSPARSGSGVRDGRGRGPQARPVPIRRHGRDVGEGVVETRSRLASVVLPCTSSPTRPTPTPCSS